MCSDAGFSPRRPRQELQALPEPAPAYQPRRGLALRNPEPADEADEPPGAAPDGRVRLGAREQAHLDWMVEVLRRLDRADRAAVRELVRHMAKKAGMLPPADDQAPRWGTRLRTLSVPPRVPGEPKDRGPSSNSP